MGIKVKSVETSNQTDFKLTKIPFFFMPLPLALAQPRNFSKAASYLAARQRASTDAASGHALSHNNQCTRPIGPHAGALQLALGA